MTDNFRKDLEIDQYALDRAWLGQAGLYAEWAEKAVDADFAYEKAREQYDVLCATTEKDIRMDPAKYGIDKFTEGAVKVALACNQEIQAKNEEVLEARKRAKLLAVARDAFDHRKRALEKLTDLFLSKYYAEPTIRAESREIVDQQNKAGAAEALQQSMGKRKLLRREGS